MDRGARAFKRRRVDDVVGLGDLFGAWNLLGFDERETVFGHSGTFQNAAALFFV